MVQLSLPCPARSPQFSSLCPIQLPNFTTANIPNHSHFTSVLPYPCIPGSSFDHPTIVSTQSAPPPHNSLPFTPAIPIHSNITRALCLVLSSHQPGINVVRLFNPSQQSTSWSTPAQSATPCLECSKTPSPCPSDLGWLSS